MHLISLELSALTEEVQFHRQTRRDVVKSDLIKQADWEDIGLAYGAGPVTTLADTGSEKRQLDQTTCARHQRQQLVCSQISKVCWPRLPQLLTSQLSPKPQAECPSAFGKNRSLQA